MKTPHMMFIFQKNNTIIVESGNKVESIPESSQRLTTHSNSRQENDVPMRLNLYTYLYYSIDKTTKFQITTQRTKMSVMELPLHTSRHHIGTYSQIETNRNPYTSSAVIMERNR